MKRIALFGTSADPPTSGHQEILRWLSEQYDWVAVWAADNPFKTHQTPLKHRATMLRLLIESTDPPPQNVGCYPELASHRTIETVEKVRQRWGTAVELTLVIGADLVSQLPRWYRFSELLQQVKLLVLPRPGYELIDTDLQQIRQLGAEIAIADFAGPDVSSTAYREGGDTQALIPPIVAYIHQEHLYKCQDTSKERLPLR